LKKGLSLRKKNKRTIKRDYYSHNMKIKANNSENVVMMDLTNHEAKEIISRKKQTATQINLLLIRVRCYSSNVRSVGILQKKCPSKKEEQSNLIEEDLEPTLLMVTVEEAPGNFINQEES
jgi:hypothetical protein